MMRKLGKKVSAVGKKGGGEKEKERLDFLARFQPSPAAFTRSPFFSFFKPSVIFDRTDFSNLVQYRFYIYVHFPPFNFIHSK